MKQIVARAIEILHPSRNSSNTFGLTIPQSLLLRPDEVIEQIMPVRYREERLTATGRGSR